MVAKRTSDGATKDAGGKRQQTLAATLAAPRAPRAAPVEVVAQAAYLDQEYTHDLEQAVDSYRLNWADKCMQKSDYNEGGVGREDVDLDGRGLRLVHAFADAAELATARGQELPPNFLEDLVLVLRNDSVHLRSHVSRAAHAALMAYLTAHPYAQLRHYSAAESGAKGKPRPHVLLSPTSAWTPIVE